MATRFKSYGATVILYEYVQTGIATAYDYVGFGSYDRKGIFEIHQSKAGGTRPNDEKEVGGNIQEK